jgi:hypothetical protein
MLQGQLLAAAAAGLWLWRCGGSVHVCALKKGVRSVKGYGKEGRGRKLGGEATGTSLSEKL